MSIRSVSVISVFFLGVAACSPTGSPRDGTEDLVARPTLGRPVEVAERRIEIESGSVWFREAGRGPVVLLIHGWRGNADQWRHQIQPLANAGLRVIAPDLPGTRNSTLGDEGLKRADVALQVQSLVQLLDHLKANSAHLVGHSWGGVIARRFVLSHPDRASTLVLVDSPVHQGEIEDLEAIECPTLIVWAENDTVASPKIGQSLSQVIPNASLVVISDVGIGVDPAVDPVASHIPPLYKPDEFNLHILRFLRDQR